MVLLSSWATIRLTRRRDLEAYLLNWEFVWLGYLFYSWSSDTPLLAIARDGDGSLPWQQRIGNSFCQLRNPSSSLPPVSKSYSTSLVHSLPDRSWRELNWKSFQIHCLSWRTTHNKSRNWRRQTHSNLRSQVHKSYILLLEPGYLLARKTMGRPNFEEYADPNVDKVVNRGRYPRDY